MIKKVGINSTNNNYQLARSNKGGEKNNNPNFKGLGAIALTGIQACERMPMVNVAVIDMLSAILPRTIVESMTNPFAGFEAFRRESSGLIVNCIIPGFITWGIAKGVNNFVMPKGSNLSGCWADSSLIDKATDYYKNAKSDDKIKESIKTMIGDIEGFDGKNRVLFKETFTNDELDKYATKLTELVNTDKHNKKMLDAISNNIIKKTHVAENINLIGENRVHASSVNSLLTDTVKYYKEFQKAEKSTSIEQFAKQSKKLVKTKSLAGLAVVLPLAISMQYINRWITGKLSGTKGAPIYEDFGKGNNIEENPKAKEGLLKQKIISIASMVGVSILSMSKLPSMNMLEFKGMFPSMDQARLISTSTFASRMAAADDKNELAEATVRDIATFSSLYFLGDYAAKIAATLLQKNTGVVLLNDKKPIKDNANVFEKLKHWVSDVSLKSSEEVTSKTQNKLAENGEKLTAETKKIVEKELKHARNLRSICQIANLGVSLGLLGIVIPIFTRNNTKKKHEEALKLAQVDSTQRNKE